MRERPTRHGLIPLVTVACATLGCISLTAPLDLTSLDPATDQRKIAHYHTRDAAFFRLKAQEQAERIAVYQDLFGPESEWVHGARLLKQFYEDAAKEQEKQSLFHLSIADESRALPADRSLHPITTVR